MADELERRAGALETARRDLEDAMVVMAHLEKGQSERLKEHAQFIAQHEAAIKRHDLQMAEFDDKLNGLIDIIDRQQRGGAR
jgi:hypothetical protein